MTTAPKVLIANRGEIALRILRTARKLGIPTVAIYTLVDADTPVVSQADEAYIIGDGQNPRGYLDIDEIVAIAKKSGATMVAPGYGFLSENASFAKAIEAAGVTFLGPTPFQMTSMGLKHEARAVAIKAGVPVVPGSEGTIETLDLALEWANKIGYPVMLKASAGGGGMGMTVCKTEQELKDNFEATRQKGETLFKDSTVFLEKYIARARHVEVQIFGNGEGHVIHFGERECSVQRRHQKVIEETPCPLFLSDLGKKTRERMCAAAVALGKTINYRSAGTVEFVLDDESPNYDFYFLELNARIQVEHPITEVVRPGLDLVELLIRQGLSPNHSLPAAELDQSKWAPFDGHSIEARVYCENPLAGFRPSPGRLQLVEWADIGERGRIDTWVKTGTMVSPNYDPMIAKVIVWGKDRDAAIKQLVKVLSESKIAGPTTNLHYCRAILESDAFQKGQVTTVYLDSMPYEPPVMEFIQPGLSTTVQDLPGRFVGLGIPRGGAADMLALQAANVLVGNDPNAEGLEMTMMGSKIKFHCAATIAVTGAEMKVTIDKKEVPMWETLKIAKGSVLFVGSANGHGLRSYLAIRGGLPTVAPYMGSKSTFAGASLGGSQGRALFAGDMLDIDLNSANFDKKLSIPPASRPQLGSVWELEVTPSAQWDEEFITLQGMKNMLAAEWTVTPASNRSGLRLDGPLLDWARTSGGEGGSHPSNLIDQGYAFGALNFNGDTPVLFGVDGPDMGGFSCVLTVARPSMWKLGQMRPADKVRFVLITRQDSEELDTSHNTWLNALVEEGDASAYAPSAKAKPADDASFVSTSVLYTRGDVTVREAGDEFILFEVGEMTFDMKDRVKVELWERALRAKKVPGIVYFNTCVRSSLIHFDPKIISMGELVKVAVDAARGLDDVSNVEIPMTVWKMPVVPNDRWTRADIEYYMKSARKEAVYLPDNCKYIARNNGLPDTAVTDALLGTPWFIIALGFFVMLPFHIPLDPRFRLLAQKYNPSRVKTTEGAIGLAGVIASIYPIESPGGYQLLGRTLTTFRAWNDKPCLVNSFDQMEFFEVTEDEFVKIEANYKAGIYQPESRQDVFKMKQYLEWIGGMKDEIDAFKAKQKAASEEVAKEEAVLFAKWTKEKEEEAKAIAAQQAAGGSAATSEGTPIPAPLSANVWKFYVKPGDIIEDDDQRIVELEAMKTSVWVTPGEETKGKKVVSLAVKEGDSVSPGQVLLYLE
ncbi:hypothetical protein Q8F55_005407 [Vanrija albida]|uniref:Urea carboxylase n=1 Tax=Vanrija albida TaxID=181172 RepID=A0ABR3Q1K4_9TREE